MDRDSRNFWWIKTNRSRRFSTDNVYVINTKYTKELILCTMIQK